MWILTEDVAGAVCVNMNTGMRFRPGKDKTTGMPNGVQLIFPDGNSNIQLRTDFAKLVRTVEGKTANGDAL